MIGAIHPHRLRAFLDGVPEPVLGRAERATLAAFSIMVSHYDLKEPAQYYAGSEVAGAIMLEYMSARTLSEMLDDFDTLKRGRISERVLIAGGDESITDPSRVPPGRGMFHGITFAPYNLAEGGPARWDEIREQMGDRSLAAYRRFVKNLTAENIVKRTIVYAVGPCPQHAEQHGRRRCARRGTLLLSDWRPSPDPGFGAIHGARHRALLLGGTLPASRRRCVWRRPRDRHADVRASWAWTSRRWLRAKLERRQAPPPSSPARQGAVDMALTRRRVAAERRDSVRSANEELMTIRTIERDGDDLVVKGQAYGTMPITVLLRPEQARRLVKLVRLSLLPFLIGFLFRRGRRVS